MRIFPSPGSLPGNHPPSLRRYLPETEGVDQSETTRVSEELDALYGKPAALTTITHVLGKSGNINHDLFTIEVLTEDFKRLNVRFTQAASRNLFALIKDQIGVERPKAH